LTTEKWALIRGLRILLKPFDSVTKYLSGEKYPSFTSTMPFTERFTDVDASILWSSLVDPRFVSATYLFGPEKYKGKYLLQNEVLYLVMQD